MISVAYATENDTLAITTIIACSLTLNGPGFSGILTLFNPLFPNHGNNNDTSLSGMNRAHPLPIGLQHHTTSQPRAINPNTTPSRQTLTKQ